MEIFFNADYSVMWAALGTIVAGLASILSIIALIYTMTTFTKSLHESHYSELDSMYFELLKAALDKTHLVNKKASRSDDQQLEYETYAFMVWNFLEAVYDRCNNDSQLCDTWYPVIDAENNKHREWFERAENKPKFKKEFHEFIESNSFK